MQRRRAPARRIKEQWYVVMKWGPPQASIGEEVLGVLARNRTEAVNATRKGLGPGVYSAYEAYFAKRRTDHEH